MNYIYDILLNLNREIYDFYDWNQDDEVMHIKKAPIFLVDSSVVEDLTMSDVLISSDFLDKIYKKTEIFTSRVVKNISYLSIFSDGNSAIAIKFTKDGKNNLKSKFLIDEDIEINNLVLHLSKSEIKYTIKKKNNIINETRFKRTARNFIKDRLQKLDDLKQIKYLNYELFASKSDDKNELLKNVAKDFDSCYLKVYNFFKLIGTKNN